MLTDIDNEIVKTIDDIKKMFMGKVLSIEKIEPVIDIDDYNEIITEMRLKCIS
jgi:hypothetical protein